MPRISLRTIREYEAARIVELFPPGSRVLEIGAGAGWQSRLLADHGMSVEAIDVASSRYESRRVWPVRVYDGRTIPFPDAHFDIVFSSNVLEHVEQLDELLGETKRVLRSHGVAIHVVPSSTWRLWSMLATIVNAWRRLFRTMVAQLWHRFILRDMTSERALVYRQDLARWLKQAFWVPETHVVVGNAFTELHLFRRRHWTTLFEDIGWTVRDYFPNRLFYSGGTCLTYVGIPPRRLLSLLLGSSAHMYVLEPGVGARASTGSSSPTVRRRVAATRC